MQRLASESHLTHSLDPVHHSIIEPNLRQLPKIPPNPTHGWTQGLDPYLNSKYSD